MYALEMREREKKNNIRASYTQQNRTLKPCAVKIVVYLWLKLSDRTHKNSFVLKRLFFVRLCLSVCVHLSVLLNIIVHIFILFSRRYISFFFSFAFISVCIHFIQAICIIFPVAIRPTRINDNRLACIKWCTNGTNFSFASFFSFD